MPSPSLKVLLCACLLGEAAPLFAQQAVAPPGSVSFAPPPAQSPNVTLDGMALAQTDAAIEQSRLRAQTTPPIDLPVDANGNALAVESVDSEDDSLGAQRFLKAQERVRSFVVTGGISLVYTSNVALTRRATRHDVFAVVDAGIGWNRRLARNLEGTFSARASLFRYDRTPELDFENLGFGAGLAYFLEKCGGIVVFGRYDFTELLDRDGHQILMDHALSLGVQKGIALGRSHGISLGAIGTAGFSDPEASERSQISGFVGYHLQITRRLETDFLFRPSVYFYTDGGRTDFNQILSWSARYRFTDWAEINTTFTYGINRSDTAVFDYNLLTGGGSAGVTIRF